MAVTIGAFVNPPKGNGNVTSTTIDVIYPVLFARIDQPPYQREGHDITVTHTFTDTALQARTAINNACIAAAAARGFTLAADHIMVCSVPSR